MMRRVIFHIGVWIEDMGGRLADWAFDSKWIDELDDG